MEVEAHSVPSASAALSNTDPSKKNPPLPMIRPDKRLLSYMQMTKNILQGLHNGRYTANVMIMI